MRNKWFVAIRGFVIVAGLVTGLVAGGTAPALAMFDKSESTGSSGITASSTSTPEDLHIAGTLESVVGNVWTVAGQSFTVDSSTHIEGSTAPGDAVKVEVIQGPDGLVAVEIEGPDLAMDDSSSSETDEIDDVDDVDDVDDDSSDDSIDDSDEDSDDLEDMDDESVDESSDSIDD